MHGEIADRNKKHHKTSKQTNTDENTKNRLLSSFMKALCERAVSYAPVPNGKREKSNTEISSAEQVKQNRHYRVTITALKKKPLENDWLFHHIKVPLQ